MKKIPPISYYKMYQLNIILGKCHFQFYFRLIFVGQVEYFCILYAMNISYKKIDNSVFVPVNEHSIQCKVFRYLCLRVFVTFATPYFTDIYFHWKDLNLFQKIAWVWIIDIARYLNNKILSQVSVFVGDAVEGDTWINKYR